MKLPEINTPEGVDADSFELGVVEGLKVANAINTTVWEQLRVEKQKRRAVGLCIHILLAVVYSGVMTFGCGYNVMDWQYWALLGCLLGIQFNLMWW